MQDILQHIRSIYQLTEQQATVFLSAFSLQKLQKDDIFVERGKVCHKIGLVEKGLMKCVYLKDGEEVVYEFAYENNFISDYYSFVTSKPSEKEIKCLEETTIHVIHRQTLQQLAAAHPFIESISRQNNEALFLRAHDRVKSLLLHSATERYQQLIARRPDLAQRIPQYLLASYLHVKPETISRIRKKMATR